MHNDTTAVRLIQTAVPLLFLPKHSLFIPYAPIQSERKYHHAMKHTSKYTCSLLLLLAAAAAFTACGTPSDKTDDAASSDTSAQVQTEASVHTVGKIAEALADTCPFSEALTQNDAYLANHPFGFSALGDKLVSYTAYVPVGIIPEEILVFETADASDTQAIVDKLNAYVAYQTSEYESYAASQVPKLENPVIVTHGNFVIYVISADNAAAKEAVGALFD